MAKLTMLHALVAAAATVSALSNTDMRRPDGVDSLLASSAMSTERHVVFGHVGVTSSSSSGRGWSFESAGNSWHVWNYKTIFDRIDLPQWPVSMQQARIVLSSGMCRDDTVLPPFVPPREIEHCGSHILATAASDIQQGAPMAAARAQMRMWMAWLMGWDQTDSIDTGNPLGPSAFIGLGNTSIYHFSPFAAKSINQGYGGSQLDLVSLALGPSHHLRDLTMPKVTTQNAAGLDNYRVEIKLQRTDHGFVKITTQMISRLPTASQISIEPTDNADSRISWIGPTSDAPSFTLGTNQSKPEPLSLPSDFFTQPNVPSMGGQITSKAIEFASFHPTLSISTHLPTLPLSAQSSACQHLIVVMLPRTYFVDPYQLFQLQANQASFHHYGQTELEKPAEAVSSWGSLLVLSSCADLNFSLPIHARYRLLPVQGPLVGYNGEPSESTHVDVALPPPIAVVACPAKHSADRLGLDVRPAVFDELGLDPINVLQTTPDTDLLVRMPVPDDTHATLIQISTIGLLFAGTMFIIQTTYAKKSFY
ncbi:hypothetical protein IWW40_001547 [Coemansia sp. RSA 1250]|nr:hypothetical protein IWW40_001547 [Coemansia sp. RSA 1250]